MTEPAKTVRVYLAADGRVVGEKGPDAAFIYEWQLDKEGHIVKLSVLRIVKDGAK